MKNILILFLALTVGCVAQTGVHDVKANNGTNTLLLDLAVPTGKTFTVQSGGVFNADNGRINVSGAAESNRAIYLQTGTAPRWKMWADATAESGANAGSNFELWATSDNGLSNGRVMLITRSTGAVTFDNSVAGASFIGPLTGNASTTTALANARTIGGSSFNGTANIVSFTALAVRDTSAAFDLSLIGTSSPALSAGRTLTVDVSNANRILKMTGNTTLNQAVDTTASPTFIGATLTGTPLGSVSGGTGFASYSPGDMLYHNGSVFAKIPAGSPGTPVLTLSSNVPGWSSSISVGSVDTDPSTGTVAAHDFRIYQSNGFYQYLTLVGTTLTGTRSLGIDAGDANRSLIIRGTTGTTVLLGDAGLKRVTADVTVTNSTTATDITGLSVSLEAGKTYSFVANLYSATTGATATCGMKAGLAASAGLTATDLRWGIVHNYSPAGNGPAAALSLSSTSNSFTTIGSDTVGLVNTVTVISGTITVNAGGTFTIQGAQNTAAASCTAIFRRGSWLELKQY